MNPLNRFFENPVFIVGNGRTGTTALRIGLGLHPQIIARSGEAPLVSKVGRLVYFMECQGTSGYVKKSLKVKSKDVLTRLRKLCVESVFGTYFGFYFLIKVFFKKKILSHKLVWLCKTFPNEQDYQGIQVLFPKAKFIFIFRNGIDQIASSQKRWKNGSFEQHCKDWENNFQYYEYMFDNPNCVIVRHEELVENPESVMRSIYNLLGISEDNRPAQFLKNAKVNTTNPTQATSIKSYLSDKIPAYQTWTEQERKTFVDICGKTMSKLSYEIPFL
jgi:Sulfotransferase family